MNNEEKDSTPISRKEWLLKMLGVVSLVSVYTFWRQFRYRKKERSFWLIETNQKDLRFQMAKEIVAASQFLVKDGGLQQVVQAINKMNSSRTEKVIPFDAFKETSDGWFELKNPEEFWPNFWNFKNPIPLGFLSPPHSEENIERSSNYFYPWNEVYITPGFAQKIGKQRLGVLPSAIVEEGQLLRIDCSGGIFPCGPRNNFRFFPMTRIGFKGGTEEMRTVLSLASRLPAEKWYDQLRKEGIFVPLDPDSLLIDNWYFDKSGEIKVYQPRVKVHPFSEWLGFGEEGIHPFQLVEVGKEKEERSLKLGLYELRMRFPKAKFLPFAVLKEEGPAGVWREVYSQI